MWNNENRDAGMQCLFLRMFFKVFMTFHHSFLDVSAVSGTRVEVPGLFVMEIDAV